MKRLASVILSIAITLGAIQSYVLYRDSFPTPAEAVNDHIIRITVKSHSPQKIESLDIVSSAPSNQEGDEQLLLFQAYDRGLETHIAGYATLQRSLFGWHVDQFHMTGRSPLPQDVMADFGGPIVFGQVILPDATRIEAVFSDPNQGDVTIGADLSKGSFAVFGTPDSEMKEFRILDVNGHVMKRLTRDELQNR